jgi:RAQPRD family integrative conjugative element protein
VIYVERSMRKTLVLLFITIMLARPAFADAGGERAKLAQLIRELEALEPLMNEAAAQANPDTRIRFQYGWLKQDIDRITLGIREHIDAPRSEPRTFPPLKGDYRR